MTIECKNIRVEGTLIDMQIRPGYEERANGIVDKLPDSLSFLGNTATGIGRLFDRCLPPSLDLTFTYLDPDTRQSQIVTTVWTGCLAEQERIREKHLLTEGKDAREISPWQLLIDMKNPVNSRPCLVRTTEEQKGKKEKVRKLNNKARLVLQPAQAF